MGRYQFEKKRREIENFLFKSVFFSIDHHTFFFARLALPNTGLEAMHSLYTLLLREYVESLVNITELSTSFTRLGVASKSGEFSLMLKYGFLIIKQTQVLVSKRQLITNQSTEIKLDWGCWKKWQNLQSLSFSWSRQNPFHYCPVDFQFLMTLRSSQGREAELAQMIYMFPDLGWELGGFDQNLTSGFSSRPEFSVSGCAGAVSVATVLMLPLQASPLGPSPGLRLEEKYLNNKTDDVMT